MINDYEATEPITSTAAPTHASEALSNDDVISCLNHLIETCRDGQNGFREAAEAIETSTTRSFLLESSQERAKFVGELQALVRDLGGDAVDEGSIAGAIHRGWIDLRAAIAGNDEHSVLVEAERGEDYAKKAYKDALEQDLPLNIHETVIRQYQSIIDTHNTVRELRDDTPVENLAPEPTVNVATGGTGGF